MHRINNVSTKMIHKGNTKLYHIKMQKSLMQLKKPQLTYLISVFEQKFLHRPFQYNQQKSMCMDSLFKTNKIAE